jgi:hypothetical protein
MPVDDDERDCFYRWAFQKVYKTQSTKVSRSDLYYLIQNYSKHVEDNFNILNLFELCDFKKNKALDTDELRILLSVTQFIQQSLLSFEET